MKAVRLAQIVPMWSYHRFDPYAIQCGSLCRKKRGRFPLANGNRPLFSLNPYRYHKDNLPDAKIGLIPFENAPCSVKRTR